MLNLYDYEFNKLVAELTNRGQSKYRATQLYKWIYKRNVTDFDQMSDISKAFRDELNRDFILAKPSIYREQHSEDGTMKLLLQLSDGALVETVLMRYSYGNVVCVTSQVGCNMGCSFCASGLLKKQRDLTPGEMLGQVLVVNDLLRLEGHGARTTHIVVMGTGEPFDNYQNVLDFVRIANHPHALEIGARHITISTCGLSHKIKEFAHEGLQVNLAISLHAANDELRSQIMKINKAHPLDLLMDAVKYYELETNRRVTFEYILLAGVNDSTAQADELSDLIRGTNAYVNLIPFNPVSELPYNRSSDQNVKAFLNQLIKRGITATVRKEFGTDIDAACGQLRAKEEKRAKS